MIFEHVKAWAEATPERTALRQDGVDISYDSFRRRIENVTGSFLQRGYPGSGVAVLAITQLANFWICSLALRRLGITTITVASPDEIGRLPLPLRMVVTTDGEDSPSLHDCCAALGLPLIVLSDEDALNEHEARLPDSLEAGGHILQTSGTTGSYKLVLYDSSAEAAMLRWSPGFDQSTMFHVLKYGAWTLAAYLVPLYVWSAGGGIIIQQAGELHEAFTYEDGTHALVLPFFLDEILRAPEGAFPRNDRLELHFSGGTCTETQLAEARRRISPRIFNWMGSTEAGPIASTELIEPDDNRWHKVVAGRIVEVVDDEGEAVPVGRTGHLRVATAGGPGEYLADPETTRRFFRDGYFYPGDLAVAREDGRFALEGRSTDVVDVKAVKISPSAVEDALREALSVPGVCLISFPNARGEEQLYLLVESADPVDVALIAPLVERYILNEGGLVPNVPSVPRSDINLTVCSVPSLPRTSTGKIIRSEVRATLIPGLLSEA